MFSSSNTEVANYKVIGLGKTGCSALKMLNDKHISFVSIDYDLKVELEVDESERIAFNINDENMIHSFEEKLDCPWFAVLLVDLNDDFPQDKLFAIAECIKNQSSFSVVICISENQKEIEDSVVYALQNKVDSCFLLTQDCLKHIMTRLRQFRLNISNPFVLAYLCQSLFDLLSDDGVYAIDHHDLTVLLSDKGIAGIGLGVGRGKNRAKEAFRQALKSPALQQFDGGRVGEVLVCVYAPPGTRIEELEEISTAIDELGAMFLADLHENKHLRDELIVILVVTRTFDEMVSYQPFVASSKDYDYDNWCELTVPQIITYYWSTDCHVHHEEDEIIIHSSGVSRSSITGHEVDTTITCHEPIENIERIDILSNQLAPRRCLYVRAKYYEIRRNQLYLTDPVLSLVPGPPAKTLVPIRQNSKGSGFIPERSTLQGMLKYTGFQIAEMAVGKMLTEHRGKDISAFFDNSYGQLSSSSVDCSGTITLKDAIPSVVLKIVSLLDKKRKKYNALLRIVGESSILAEESFNLDGYLRKSLPNWLELKQVYISMHDPSEDRLSSVRVDLLLCSFS